MRVYGIEQIGLARPHRNFFAAIDLQLDLQNWLPDAHTINLTE